MFCKTRFSQPHALFHKINPFKSFRIYSFKSFGLPLLTQTFKVSSNEKLKSLSSFSKSKITSSNFTLCSTLLNQPASFVFNKRWKSNSEKSKEIAVDYSYLNDSQFNDTTEESDEFGAFSQLEEVIKFYENGDFELSPFSLNQVLKELKGINIRDLRMLETTRRQISAILIRENCIIVSLEYIKALITFKPQNVMLFNIQNPSTVSFGTKLAYSITRNQGQSWAILVLETILRKIYRDFSSRLQLLTPVVEQILSYVVNQHGRENEALMKIVPMEKNINSFESKMIEFQTSLQDVLDDSSTFSHVLSQTENNDIMSLLQNYERKTEEIVNELTEIHKNIFSTQKFVEMSLASTRNRLIQLNLQASLITMAFSGGAFISGIFGMNIPHILDGVPGAFFYAISAIGLISSSLYILFRFFLYRSPTSMHSRVHASNRFFESISGSDYVHKVEGHVTREEFQMIIEAVYGEQEASRYQDVFDQFDQNNDGLLTHSELHSAFKFLNESNKYRPLFWSRKKYLSYHKQRYLEKKK